MSSILAWPQAVWTWLWSIKADTWAAVAALLSAGAAVGAWRTACQSKEAATTLTLVEKRRWHAERTPQFNVTCTAMSDGNTANLVVTLIGPSALDRIDRLILTVRDENRKEPSPLAGAADAEQLAAYVWGPYRLRPLGAEADRTGRTALPADLPLGESQVYTLERSIPPHWVSDAGQWRRERDNAPVRISLYCERDGDDPWTVPMEIPVEAANSATGA
ncbi:hypothetical protein GCM10017673_40430 [Streptosporangium violaceochromogenes]|nr:hypothetical protein GCM10017673_40430 [Streptosporangium violaceochromogenes]